MLVIVLSSATATEHGGQSSSAALVVTSPPLASVTAKSKERKRSSHRVRKNSKSKKGESSPTSPPIKRSSREPSTMLEESGQNMNLNQPSYAYQDQTYPGGPMPGLQQPTFAQYPSPPYQTMQSPMQGPHTLGPYQVGQVFNNQNAYQTTYSPQPQTGYSVEYSSRIEDIARGPNGPQDDTDPNQPYIRSQYITARQDSVWRATR